MKWIVLISIIAGYLTGVQKLAGVAMNQFSELSSVYTDATSDPYGWLEERDPLTLTN